MLGGTSGGDADSLRIVISGSVFFCGSLSSRSLSGAQQSTGGGFSILFIQRCFLRPFPFPHLLYLDLSPRL